MDSSVMINHIHDVSSINEINTTELYSTSITTYMKNEIVYEIDENEEYLSCLNSEEEISKMQQHSVSDTTEIKYFSNILGNELTVFEATDDESMAVEALRQLGSMYSSNTDVCPEQNAKHYDTNKPSACKKTSTFTESDYNNHLPCHQKFVCKVCAQSFVSLTELRAHTAANHPGDRPYKCRVCLQNFPRPSSLTNHLKIHNYQPGRALLVSKQQQQVSCNNLVAAVSKQQVNSAPTCLKFENIDTIPTWPVEQVYVPVNNNTVSDTDPLATSWQFTTGNYDSTNIGELDTGDLDNHQFNNSGELVFDNETDKLEHQQRCLKTEDDAAQVQEKEDNGGEKKKSMLKHACPGCDKRFTTKQKMFRHMWIHRKKSFACEHCARTFELQPELDKHRLSTHPADSPYVCQACGKCFASRQGLWEHGRLHGSSGTSSFTCAKCHKSFASRQGYLIHNRIHTGERPYGCRYCLKAFRDGGTLRKHERIHTGERPHVCPICKHDFNQKVVLREHVRWVHAAAATANSEVSFICQLCDATVSDREELCAHIVRHSDLTRHNNNNTGTTTVSPARNKKLTMKQTQKSSNECDLCGKKFTSHEDLMTHVHIHI